MNNNIFGEPINLTIKKEENKEEFSYKDLLTAFYTGFFDNPETKTILAKGGNVVFVVEKEGMLFEVMCTIEGMSIADEVVEFFFYFDDKENNNKKEFKAFSNYLKRNNL